MDWLAATFWLFVFAIMCLAFASVWTIFYYILFYAMLLLSIPILIAGILAIHMRIKGYKCHTYHIFGLEITLEKKDCGE